MQSVLYGHDYRAMAVAYRQINRVAAMIAPPVPVVGWVEHDGARYDDPFFCPQVVELKAHKESAAKRLAAICKALNEGEIEAALMMAAKAA